MVSWISILAPKKGLLNFWTKSQFWPSVQKLVGFLKQKCIYNAYVKVWKCMFVMLLLTNLFFQSCGPFRCKSKWNKGRAPHIFLLKFSWKIVLNAVFMRVRKTKDTRQLYKVWTLQLLLFSRSYPIAITTQKGLWFSWFVSAWIATFIFFRNFFGVMVNPWNALETTKGFFFSHTVWSIIKAQSNFQGLIEKANFPITLNKGSKLSVSYYRVSQ